MKEDEAYKAIGKFAVEFETINLWIRECIKYIESYDKNKTQELVEKRFVDLYNQFIISLKKITIKEETINQLRTKLDNLRKERNFLFHSRCLPGYTQVTLRYENEKEILKETVSIMMVDNYKKNKTKSYTKTEFENILSDLSKLRLEIKKIRLNLSHS